MDKQGTKSARQSGFEFVRIIAMIMIVANHLVNHGIFKVTSAEPYALWPQMSSFNQAAGALISCGGRVGVAVFFMITGYFLADREKLSVRSVFSFLARVHFFGVLMFAVFMVLRLTSDYGSTLDLYKVAKHSLFKPVVIWWFAMYYLILLFLAPSINVLIKYMNRKAFFLILILYIWFFFYKSGNEELLPVDLIRAILFYMMGAFVRVLEQKKETAVSGAAASQPAVSGAAASQKAVSAQKNGTAGEAASAAVSMEKSISVKNAGSAKTPGAAQRSFSTSAAGLIVHVIIFLALFLLCGYFMYNTTLNTVKDPGAVEKILFWTPSRFLNDVLIPLDGLALLMVGKFRFTSNIVNKISACTFSVYLLHDYSFIRSYLWHNLLKVDTVQYSSRFFLLYVLFDVAVIFLAGILIETIRVRLGSLFQKKQ